MTKLIAGLLAVAAVTFAACGGSGSGTEDGPRPAASAPSASPGVAIGDGEGCAAAAGMSGNVSDRGSAVAGGAELDIEAGDFFFAPTCEIDVSAGTVTLVVTNTGGALHNVSIPDQGIDEDVDAGDTISLTVDVGSSPIQYFCKYHRTSGMVGALLP